MKVPVLSRAVENHRGNDDLTDVVDDDDDDEEMLPPHELVARGSGLSARTTFSVLEGAGRTLNGRDLCQANPDFRKRPIVKVVLNHRFIITIHAEKPQSELKDALAVGDKVRRLSLSEQKLEKAGEDHGTDVIRFTQKNILRVYPKGSRVNSSNYKPHVGWVHGAQMVAFNMQGNGKYNWLMHGMFRANGGCGYLKKPDFLMYKGPNNEVFDPKNSFSVKKTLKVKIYMGNGWHLDFSRTHFNSFSPPDFYTKVYVVGVPADCSKLKTKIIDDDWLPVWDEEFTFPLTIPEEFTGLSFL